MTREDIIRMAREAGFEADEPANDVWITDGYWADELERFAALVAAYTLSNIDPSKLMSFQEGYAVGVAAEREACAKVCDENERANLYGVKECASAIRARGEK